MTTVCVGCGLTVTSEGRLAAATSGSWGVGGLTFPACDDTGGTPTYCDAAGQLRGVPEHFAADGGVAHCEDPAPAMGQFVTSDPFVITNPSPCRQMIGMLVWTASWDVRSPGLLRFAVELSENGGAFTEVASGFLPGGEGLGATIRSNTGQTNAITHLIPPADVYVVRVRAGITESVADAGNAWLASCVGAAFLGTTV